MPDVMTLLHCELGIQRLRIIETLPLTYPADLSAFVEFLSCNSTLLAQASKNIETDLRILENQKSKLQSQLGMRSVTINYNDLCMH
jgi:hypothetical protein